MSEGPIQPADQRRPHSRMLGFAVILVAATGLLTWLFFQARAVTPGVHQAYLAELHDLGELDAEVDGEVLAARLRLILNYDALTAYMADLQTYADYAADPPDYLSGTARERLLGKAEALRAALAEKALLVDSFKRKNAVLHNAIAFLSATNDRLFDAREDTDRPEVLERYVRDTLLYVGTPTPIRRYKMEASLAALQEAVWVRGGRDHAENVIRHGAIAASHMAEVTQITQDLLALPTNRLHDELFSLYSVGHANAIHKAEQFRILLFVTALLLIAYLTATFIHLETTRRSLIRANREILAGYEAQKRAERHLRLHATAFNSSHEGISLTDAKGNILEVNPAFTRITGYEREEVIGRNPRVLKSGRHDAAFYTEMWQTISQKGSWRGEIWNRNKFGEVYPELLSISSVRDSDGEVTNYVAVFSDIRRLKEQEKQLKQLAFYDPLTDLPNRVLLVDRLVQGMAQSNRNGTIMVVCYLDLDGFKPINDTYGHEAGDMVLREMARRFSNRLRGGDTVSRLGGDEFVLLFMGLKQPSECDQMMRRLLQTIAQPISVHGVSVTFTASIGVTLYPEDNSDTDTLLRHADQAMYLAKQGGKNNYHIFDPAEDRTARIQNSRITRIEEALENQELVLFYQPKVDLRRGTVVGVEALLRWNHPSRGLVPPLEFLPLIEGHELIVRIGAWVLETAVAQAAAWRAQGLALSVSINVAALQLQAPDFVQLLRDILDRHPSVPNQDIELEILESAALGDVNQVSRVIGACQELGISFALDDFGTGYSSLTYLKRLPASTLKIDQSFVRDMLLDPENLAIVQGTLGLATAFQRTAVAEGVETVEHGTMLIQLGCHIAQGYGISKPIPAAEIAPWVAGWTVPPEWRALNKFYWDDNDFPLFSFEVEHRRWITLLIHAIKEGVPIPHSVIHDPMKCRFGKWYYGKASEIYAHTPGFEAIETPHTQVHRIAAEIDRFYTQGEVEAAQALIPDLLEQRDAVLAAIKDLQIQVAHFSEDARLDQ
ncbi:MAG: EAL domain-containing protein [Rhodospirillaceae bacterium]